MTLDQFLAMTAAVPELTLRSAMTAALAVEPARTPAAYRRFYTRVVRELGLDAGVISSSIVPHRQYRTGSL